MADLNNNDKTMDRDVNRDVNPDPITGAPGSHPVGTGIGAAAGGVGGAAAGAAAGAAIGATTTGPAAPIGGIVGAVIGAVAGGYAGKGVAEHIDPTREDAYWRENHKDRPYVKAGSDYTYEDDYQPAYRYGWESRAQNQDKNFDDVRDDLRRDWDTRKGRSKLTWDEAEDACCDAWNHCDRPTDTRNASQGQQPPAL